MERRDLTDLRVAAALAAGAFALYAAGACRTIYVGDSGELVAAVHTLGIPHPSGYPLYVLLGKAFTILAPIGSVAFRMSLFSALFAALAVGMLYRVARAVPVERGAAAAAAVLFAASPSFWGEANVQRVYSLNAFFVSLASLLALRWASAAGDEEKQKAHTRGWLFITLAFVCGLGASNHTFLAVWGLVFSLFALFFVDRTLWRRWRMLLAAALAAGAGLSVYLFLFFRARQAPRLNWSSPDSFDALVGVVTRRDFWPRRWWSGWNDLAPILGDFFSSFATELTLVGALFALAGLVVGIRRRWSLVFLLLLVALANVAVMAAHGSRSDLFIWHRYYIPAYFSASVLAALGLDAALEWAGKRGAAWSRAAAALALAGALALVALRFPAFDRSRYEIADAYSRRLLASMPPGAHLAASDDNILFVLIYLQLVDGVRPDVDLILQGVGGELPPLRFDPEDSPLFFTHHPNWKLAELDVVPAGLAFQVVRAGSAPAAAASASAVDPGELPGESDPRVPKDYLTRNLIGELHFLRAVNAERADPALALAELERAARAAPDNDVLFYNLGLVYERMGRADLALAAFERSRDINPRPIPGPSRVRAEDRIRELRSRAAR